MPSPTDRIVQALNEAETAPPTADLLKALEAALDSRGLARVLHDLAGICADKATHVREAWQDRLLADRWNNAAAVLRTAANREPVRRVS